MKVKRNARLAAVQVIFQYYFSKADIENIVEEYHSFDFDHFQKKKSNYDKKLFTKIVSGVSKNEMNIRTLVENNLSDNWNYERIDPTMRSILSLAVYELSFCAKTPHKVIIDEYVTIAGFFFNKLNTGFINGILDNLSKKIRK